MTRHVALRAGALFAFLAVLFGSFGAVSYAPAAQALSLIVGSLCALMLLFGLAAPSHAHVPARVRSRRLR